MSMGMTSARHARECVANAEMVVAMEALAAAQGLDLRAPLEPAQGTLAARDELRRTVPFLDSDREIRLDVHAAIEAVRSNSLVAAAERAVGPLA